MLETSGRIAQSGSFAELQAQDGYVRSLALKTRSSHEIEDIQNADTETTADPAAAKAAGEDESDFTRQTGDRSLYKFYLKSTGIPLSLGFLLIAICCVGVKQMSIVWYVLFLSITGQASFPPPRSVSNTVIIQMIQ